MSKRTKAAVAVDADVRAEDPIVEIEVPEMASSTTPVAPADPIDEASVRVLRSNLRAQGITGAAQDAQVAAHWAARNR